MICEEFEFHAPRELAEVFLLLARYGDGARLLAGGMSLVPMMALELVQPGAVISLNRLSQLDYVVEERDAIRIGAMTRHHGVMTNELVEKWCPLLAEAAGHIGDVQVRNRGTIGGSLSHADPAASYLPVTVVVGAQIRLQSAQSSRLVAARDFVTGMMQTAARSAEVLTEVIVPKAPGAGYSYEALRRVEGGFPIVNVAALIAKDRRNGLLAIGGAGSKPAVVDLGGFLARGASEAALRAIGAAAYEATADAPEDINGSGEYRREMARLFARRASATAFARLGAAQELT